MHKGETTMYKITTMLCLGIFLTINAGKAQPSSIPQLHGQWTCVRGCGCEPVSRRFNSVAQDGRHLHVTDVCSNQYDGYIKEDNETVIFFSSTGTCSIKHRITVLKCQPSKWIKVRERHKSPRNQ